MAFFVLSNGREFSYVLFDDGSYVGLVPVVGAVSRVVVVSVSRVLFIQVLFWDFYQMLLVPNLHVGEGVSAY